MEELRFFDEMLDESGGARAPYRDLAKWLEGKNPAELRKKSREAEVIFRRLGITFAVYGTSEATERLIPFDIMPRIISASEWRRLSAGIDQRVKALNAFLHDIYHRQEIIRAGRIPADLIIQNEAFLPEMIGFTPPARVYAHIIGTDIVRVGQNEFYVLEDNTRTPSGVSYMLENRETMMRLFPDLFRKYRVAPVEHYPDLLKETLKSVAPDGVEDPTICVLTPGIFNSAYFEHAFLADTMGAELVEGRDLYVEGGKVWMRTTRTPQQVHVIYRRIDDAFLDPLTFRPESMLGVPGLFDAYRAGNVTICNAPGTGIADDKAIYAYVPDIIEFYTGQKPILNNVPTWNCAKEDDLKYVLDHLSEVVVKEVHGSGGYGMLIGPTSSKRELAEFRKRLEANPRNYIAQPTLSLSTCPTHSSSGVAPRHVDLRPYVLVGDKVRITPGGLTRVALKKGSLVVNSSQGGGTKDTWVLED
ncbi:circularly permuted type 2 ATP-grasp protein [Rhizobiales bacterium]|uniref:circularly permuted type 2 ATP-grasp protein n=1 Tax=Hongsoonwoonella zoysiae TaxID=2821844 RepID=UPI001560FDBB|nr:circularly permuted type 2 ATP-grasp protein [Hongsoonwoonella zoysiae]NRG16376.1 circularly permuted type 2 ATP-grasp protein [Hongsoonwoonella zoysiae]